MSQTRNTGYLTNIIQYTPSGNINFVSGSTTLMSISSSGAITTTGVISGSNAATASSVANLNQNVQITGSLGVTSTITAQTLNVQTVTSSIVYSSGSNIFGNSLSNTQQFTGSVLVTGSIGIGMIPTVSPIEILSNSDYAFRANRTTTNSKSLIALYDSPTASTSSYLIAGVDPTGNIVGYPATGSFVSVGTNGTGIRRDLILHNYDAQSVIIATNNTERLRVTGAGNVGIGTSSPNNKLDVLVASGNRIQIGTSVAGSSGEYVGGLYYASNKLLMESFLVGTGYQPVLLAPNGGNVGIGTSSPISPLQVHTAGSTTNEAAIRLRNPSGAFAPATAGIYFQGGYTSDQEGAAAIMGGRQTAANDSFLTFWTNPGGTTTLTERMRITSSGQVGIGSANSGWTLAVNSTSSNNSSTPHQIAIFGNSTSGASRGYLYIGSSAGIDWLVGKDTGGSGDNRFNLSLYTGEQRMILYTNGNYSFAGSNVSDVRLKSNINTLSLNALDKVSQLVPKSYVMTDHVDQIRYGFIAQEVQEILPDLISGTEGEKEYLGLDYNGVLAIAVKAIQELKAENDLLKEILQRNNIQ